MSLFRVLPIIAVGVAIFLSKGAVKDNMDVVGKVQNATTSGLEVEGICDLVVAEFLQEGRLPADDFSKFLVSSTQAGKGREGRDRSKDPWGTPYQLKIVTYGFEVRSAGPDAKWGTDDDITSGRSVKDMPGGLGVMPETYGQKPRREAVPNQPVAVSPITPPKQTDEETERKVLEFQMRQAERGSGYAQYELGSRYLEGRGVEKDPVKGREWLEKAAKNGNSDASRKLEDLDRK
jgi:hypothetical protein